MRLKDEIMINEDGRIIDLKYYILEEPLAECSDIIMYGVKIEMTEDFGGEIKNFEKTVHAMFTKPESIENFVRLIIENTVTPTTLENVAEEYVDKKLYYHSA